MSAAISKERSNANREQRNQPTRNPQANTCCNLRKDSNSQELGEDKPLIQEEYCKQYCTEHGYTVHPAHIYREVSSGAQYDESLQLAVMRVAASQREFDVVVIYSYDRLSRKGEQLQAIIKELEHSQVSVESVTGSAHDLAFLQFLTSMQARAFSAGLDREALIRAMQQGLQQHGLSGE